MKICLERLDNKAKLLDFHLRELRDQIKPSYAIQFMLDREFLAGEPFIKRSLLRRADK
jgi:hypothetical protein